MCLSLGTRARRFVDIRAAVSIHSTDVVGRIGSDDGHDQYGARDFFFFPFSPPPYSRQCVFLFRYLDRPPGGLIDRKDPLMTMATLAN